MEEIVQQINNNNKHVYKDDIDNINLTLDRFFFRYNISFNRSIVRFVSRELFGVAPSEFDNLDIVFFIGRTGAY